MVCKQCGGLLTIDKKNKLLICPFCGNTEPFDSLSKEEMQQMIDEAMNDVREENIQMVKQLEESNKKAIEASRTDNNIRFLAVTILLSILMVIIIIVMAFSFDSGMTVTGIYATAQLCLVIVAFVFIVKARSGGNIRFSSVGAILSVVAVISVIPGLILIAEDNSGDPYNTEKEYTWPELGLGSTIPDPGYTISYLSYSDSYLSADIENVDVHAFTEYVKKVQAAGYDIDATTKNNKYIAYDKNDNEITVSLYYDTKLSIWLNKAIDFTDFYWPKSGGIQYMPEPKAEKICLKSMYDTSAELYVRDISKSDFLKYIEELQNAGIKGYYNSESDEFRGEKDDANYTIQHQRDNIMYVKSYIYKER